jgi:O-acetyl-ADP-ribose deacetylase (regulator of RNase III)
VQLEVVSGDITQISADAIVNAANTGLRGGGGVDGAIHAAGGPAILEQCIQRFPDGLPVGGAGWTSAGDLPAKWVIHVVGPNWRAGVRDRSLLASCYRNTLAVAHQLRADSVAFPLVSAGVYGWPVDDAAAIAVSTVLATHCAVRRVLLVAYNREAEQALTTAQARFAVPA